MVCFPVQKQRRKIMRRFIWISAVIILLSGCLPPQGETPIPDADKIATYVAATMTAKVYQQEGITITPSTPSQEESGPSPTVEIPSDTPSPTLTLTATATSTPTPSPSPTLGPDDPVLSLGVPTFQDNFDGAENFYLYEDSQASYQVEDDQMVLIAKKANNYETWSLSWGDLKNFYLEITGVFGDECSGKDRYGMIFRAPDTSQGYLISISCDGSYRLSTWESDVEEYTVIKKWTSSQYINSGPGGANRLGVKAKDNKLTGFINGHQVFELNDSTFSKGRFGVLVAASDTAGFTAYLTRAAYWKLP
jgi:hypothetical protein